MSSARPTLERVRHDLLDEAHALALRVRRATRWQATLFCLAVLLLTAMALVAMDALLQREEIGLRILSLLVLLAVAAGLLVRRWLPAWRFSPQPIELARWVERNASASTDGLSTTLELAQLDPHDKRFGSATFRNLALESWVEHGSAPRWASHFDPSFGHQTRLLFGGLFLLGVAALAVWPDATWLGIKRLSLPWTAAPWPKSDNLRLLNPPHAAPHGSELQLEVTDDTPPLPAEVVLLVREADSSAEPMRMATTQVGDVAVANVSLSEADLEVAVTGGDSAVSPWHRIEVITPPAIEEFQFSVTPPSYTGESSSQIVSRRIQVLAGSRTKLSGRLSAPVEQLSLQRIGQTVSDAASADAGSEPNAIPWTVKLLDDQQTFVLGAASPPDPAEWTASESLSWQFSVQATGEVMIRLPEVWAIEVRPDSAPSVVLQEPPLDVVSTLGSVPLLAEASDDYGLASITAWARQEPDTPAPVDRGDPPTDPPTSTPESPLVSQVLWQASEGSATPAADGAAFPQQKQIEYLWTLSESLTLSEGQTWSLWLEAEDHLGQVGRSREFVFQVGSVEELVEAVRRQERQTLQRLTDLIASQQRNLDLVTRTAQLLATGDPIRQDAVDALSGVAQMQANLDRELAAGEQSIRGALSSLVQVLEQNQLTDSEIAAETQAVLRQIEDISQTAMQAANQAAYSSFQQADQMRVNEQAVDESFRDQLARASQTQRTALDRMQDVLEDMSQSESAAQVVQELKQVTQLQMQLKETTDALRIQEVSGLAAEEFTRRSHELEADQLVLARRTDDLIARIGELLQESGSSASRGTKLQRTSQILSTGRLSSTMRSAAQEVASGQLTDAAEHQQAAVATLQTALRELDTFSGSTGNLADQAAELERMAKSLSQLAADQTALADRLQESVADAQWQDLRGEQDRLRDRSLQRSAQLQASGEMTAAQRMESATESQTQASEALQNEQANAAAESATSAAEALRQIAEEAQQRANRMKAEAQQESVFQLARSIATLVAQQQPVVDELARLAALESTATLPDAEREQLQLSAADQEAARQVLRDIRQQTAQLPAFDWALSQVDRDMSRAVAAARRERLPPSLSAAEAALRKLQRVAEATAQAQPEVSPQEPSADQPEEASPAEPSRLVPPLASLKLLRGLQTDINEKTLWVDEQEMDVVDRNQQIAELAAQQQALGAQLSALLRELAASSDTNQSDASDPSEESQP